MIQSNVVPPYTDKIDINFSYFHHLDHRVRDNRLDHGLPHHLFLDSMVLQLVVLKFL